MAIMPCWKFNQSSTPKYFDCDYAWLYKDAQQFGFEQYKHLIGNNAICLRVGPILEAEDADFIATINNCPCKLKTFQHFCILHYHIQ